MILPFDLFLDYKFRRNITLAVLDVSARPHNYPSPVKPAPNFRHWSRCPWCVIASGHVRLHGEYPVIVKRHALPPQPKRRVFTPEIRACPPDYIPDLILRFHVLPFVCCYTAAWF
jgi:hypothetical protein